VQHTSHVRFRGRDSVITCGITEEVTLAGRMYGKKESAGRNFSLARRKTKMKNPRGHKRKEARILRIVLLQKLTQDGLEDTEVDHHFGDVPSETSSRGGMRG